jgi:hypothetical protein
MDENPYQSPLTHAGAPDRRDRSLFRSTPIPIPRPLRIVVLLGLALLGAAATFFGAEFVVDIVAGLLGFGEIWQDIRTVVPLALGVGVIVVGGGVFMSMSALKQLRNYVNLDRRAKDDESA